ncbi:hypothetical protein [Pedobacter sp. GR22-6]|uniref:hypothetical protein n=1 Tax=Pedobacter sp. GR22-6 TaxID=3127957 RepID=UPI00307D8A68
MPPQKSTAILYAVAILYVFTAWMSSGYYHWDEHYQIVEFANYKLGNAAIDDLAWEYKACIRPGLQPALCFIIFKCLSTLGVTSPFLLTLCLRILTAATAIYQQIAYEEF